VTGWSGLARTTRADEKPEVLPRGRGKPSDEAVPESQEAGSR